MNIKANKFKRPKRRVKADFFCVLAPATVGFEIENLNY